MDADKESYLEYYECALKLVRVGGIITVDNVFWDGHVVDENPQHQSTITLKKLNKLIHNDKRVSISMLPISDGLYLARKR